ncbi:Hypothetical predicted protein [Mytilus galloprovincialis]|uniref:Uncharacterized protein n=1 Tax=Mytilus galloprovincialis TaxID=29158 RepID=A0A8B6CA83_MYTGA|nr:Hypothetical predicted protein [Mytilus galloprovincialis]
MLNKLLGSGSYQSFDMRCMVTGQFATGKSSLVKLLVGDNVPEGRQATDGISLVEGRCGLDIETRNWIMIDPAKAFTTKTADIIRETMMHDVSDSAGKLEEARVEAEIEAPNAVATVDKEPSLEKEAGSSQTQKKHERKAKKRPLMHIICENQMAFNRFITKKNPKKNESYRS